MAIKFKLSDEEKKKINKIATAMEEEKQATRETEVSQDLPTAKLSRLSERNNSYSSRTKYPYTNKYGKGNIDLSNRPIVKNDDGSISTVRSMSFQDEEGKEVLVPTVVNGKIVSDSEAINNYYRTGEYLGKFDSVEEANEYAKELHRQQEKLYSKNNQQIYELPKAGFIANSRRTGEISNPFSDSRLINTLKKENETLKTAKEDLQPLGESSISSQTYEDMKSNDPKVSFPAKTRYLIDTAKGAITGWGKSIGQYLQTSVANDNQRVLDNKILAKFTDENGRKRLEETNKNLVEQIRKTQADKNADAIASQELSPTMQTLGNISRNLGNMAPTMALNALMPGTGNVAMFMSSSGDASGEELLKENNIQKAKLAGDLKGAIEVGAEKLTGGIKFLPKGTLDNTAVNFISKNIKSKVGQKIASKGYEVGGEVLEEVLTDIGQNTVDKFMYQDDGKVVDFDQLKETAKITVLTTLALNALGLGGSTYKEVQQQNKTNEVNSRINEAQKVINGDGYITQEQQTTNQANNNTNVERNLPTVNTENTYSNQLKQMASKEITNSNISEDYKTMMLDVLNSMNEVSDADISSIRQNINSLEDANNNKEKIRSILKRNGTFSEQIDKYVENKLPSGDFLYLGETPTILKKIGLNNEEMVLKQGKLKSIIKESSDGTDQMHGLPIETIKKIPEAIANPLNVLQSSSNKDSIVVITDLADTNERPIIASIEVNYNGQIGNIDFLSNRLTSAYGKNNYDRFMKTEIAKGNLLYDIDEGIIKELPTTRLQLPKGISSSVDTNNNISTINNSISQNNNSVKNTTTNNYMQKKQNNSNELETGEINNVINETRSSQNIQNSVEKNNIKEYNNLQLGETKNININDLSQLAKDGGHRTTEQIESLRESIRQNGIVEPIEIYRKNDGTFAIENGNHRLKIASELGIEQVPVKLVESWENIGVSTKNASKDFVQEYGGVYDDRITEKNSNIDEGRWNRERSRSGGNNQLEDSGRTRRNAEIYATKSYGNEQTSSVKNKGNNRKQEVEDSTSFNMNESSKTQDTYNELETGEWTKRKKEGEKRRKHYESIIRSNYTTDEAKAIAKSLMGTDTYVPESNSKQLELADDRISTTGADSELASLLSRATTGGTIKAEDIAIGERLIQYYSKTGNKAKLQDAIQATAMAGTTAGQTVQAMSLLNHQTPEGQAVWLQRSVDKMNKDLKRTRGEDAEQFKLTPEMLNKITNSENAKVLEQNLNEVYKELGQQLTKTTAQKIDAWRYFSMLANPRTHIRNIVGNTAMGGVQGIKNKVAGGIESAVSKINPDMERNHTVIPASKEVKAFAKADIENVVDRLGLNENKYNPKTRLENNMRTFKSDAMENTIGKAFDLNNKALEAEDGWGLKAGYVKALSEYMTANKLTPDTITDQQLGKARNFAIEQAKEATFHQDSQLASLINQLSNKNKFSKFVLDATLPFKKTPINVAKAGLEYSPVGLVKSAVYDTVQLRKGNITANKYIDNISKGLTGTGIALVGYALANCGVLKATGSDDEDKEKFEEGRGSQNYAITIGNNTYSLDWLAPSGIPLFIGAECYELMKTQKEKKTSSSDEDEYYNKVVDASMNILDSFSNAMNPMTEMSMLSGLTSALKSYDQGSSKMLAGIGTNSIKSYVNQFIPTALGQIAKTTDEYERNTTSTKTGVLPKAIDTTRTQIMNKIPGLRQKLPIKTDIWGQEQKQSDNIALRALENAVFPWARKELNSNNVDKEITKVYENTGESSVFPDTINKNLTIDKKKYVMTSKEFAKYKKQFGETSYELLKNLINSDGYKKLSDSQKQLAIEKIYSYSTEQVKIDYARQNCLKNEQSTLSQVTNAIKKTGGNTSNYFEFLANTQGLDKDSEKLEVLANSKYDEKTKKAIYENSLGKKDTKYDIVKESFTGSGLNMSKYLQYKAQEFKADKKDDGTVNGKSITGSKKDKVFDYIDSIRATYTQKLILYALEYRPRNASDREIVENYVRNMPNRTVKEKLEIMSKFAGVTLNKPDKEFPDGSYDY